MKRKYTYLFFILPLFLLGSGMAQEKVDLFIIKMFSERVVVLSPDTMGDTLSLMIENQTLSKLIGKISNQNEKILSSVSIPANKTRSFSLRVNKSDKFFFIPLSPAFQEVPLILGSKPYEIPPKN